MRIQTDDGQISQGVRPLHVTTGGVGSGTTQSQQFAYDVLTVPIGSANGIQFHSGTYGAINSGDWLYVTASGAGSPDNAAISLHSGAASNGIWLIDDSTVGGGVNLNENGTAQIQIIDFGGVGGIEIREAGAGDGQVLLIVTDADNTGGIALNDAGQGGVSIQTSTGLGQGNGGITIRDNGTGGITINGDGGGGSAVSITATTDGNGGLILSTSNDDNNGIGITAQGTNNNGVRIAAIGTGSAGIDIHTVDDGGVSISDDGGDGIIISETIASAQILIENTGTGTGSVAITSAGNGGITVQDDGGSSGAGILVYQTHSNSYLGLHPSNGFKLNSDVAIGYIQAHGGVQSTSAFSYVQISPNLLIPGFNLEPPAFSGGSAAEFYLYDDGSASAKLKVRIIGNNGTQKLTTLAASA